MIRRHWFNRTYSGRFEFLAEHLPQTAIRLLGIGNVGTTEFSSWDRIARLTRERGGRAVGCDIGDDTLTQGNQIRGDLTRLPVRSGSFDVVYLGEIIEHLWEPRCGLEEARRSLVHGGMLILDTPNSLSASSILNWWLRHLDDLGDPDHKQAFTPASLACVLEASGFEIEEMATDRKLSVGPISLRRVPGWRRLGAHLLVRARAR